MSFDFDKWRDNAKYTLSKINVFKHRKQLFRAAKDINETYMERLKDFFPVEGSLDFSLITGGALFC